MHLRSPSQSARRPGGNTLSHLHSYDPNPKCTYGLWNYFAEDDNHGGRDDYRSHAPTENVVEKDGQRFVNDLMNEKVSALHHPMRSPSARLFVIRAGGLTLRQTKRTTLPSRSTTSTQCLPLCKSRRTFSADLRCLGSSDDVARTRRFRSSDPIRASVRLGGRMVQVRDVSC